MLRQYKDIWKKSMWIIRLLWKENYQNKNHSSRVHDLLDTDLLDVDCFSILIGFFSEKILFSLQTIYLTLIK